MKKMWLNGARVWADRSSGKLELFTFVAFDSLGIYYFKNRKTGVVLGYNLHTLAGHKTFRPFLINFERLNPSAKVVDDQGNFPGFEGAGDAATGS